ncbi:hypothetical protein [Streptomyces sp. 11x1]|uniref:hypothetical protein n=1 Tax=Streptomyces sp. 11x1 TaxID=3038642 RepID=UPI00292DAFCD|nr:hypothetical protein [Streptomyces sp. 11x1]WNZ13574.1 hypothetical protein P8T65_42425 [Streptomyces sp. 11x1]
MPKVSFRPNHLGGDGRRLGAEAMSRLRGKSAAVIEDGLSDDEFARIEETFGFRFADDHRAFLAAGLPVNSPATPPEPGIAAAGSQPWPDWRHHDHDELRRRLEWPVDGVLFDVEKNQFWVESWGKRPDRVDQATEIARRALTRAPAMIPIYRHRYLPAGAGTCGHPVLSIWQTDIIYYGLDIADYIDREFAGADRPPDGASWNPQATVEFWKDLI